VANHSLASVYESSKPGKQGGDDDDDDDDGGEHQQSW